MALVIQGQDFRDAYGDVARAVLKSGEPVSPRGQQTREIIDVIVELEDPTRSLLDSQLRPAFSPAIAAAEAAQLIAGVSDPGLMVRISKNFASFRNAGVFMGAYGPRVRTQLPEIVRRLKDDNSSRQAVLTIWRPQDDLWSHEVKDIPCTVMFQFLIRNDKLVMHTTMRSNDIWWGLSYDVFQFTQLQCTLANVLDMEPGSYYHHAVSMHVYERDYGKIEDLPVKTGHLGGHPLLGFGENFTGIEGAMLEAAEVIEYAGGRTDKFSNASETMEWYGTTLNKYRP